MFGRFPKDDSKLAWTRHIKNKMMYYGLSENLLRRVLKFPKRREEGIAEGTSAAMQPTTSKKRKEEIWVMYKTITPERKSKLKKTKSPSILMISAWRYPGTTKPGNVLPIPEDALAELAKIL